MTENGPQQTTQEPRSGSTRTRSYPVKSTDLCWHRRRAPGAWTTCNHTRRSGSKSSSGRWSHWDEIGWSHFDEIRRVQLLEILHGTEVARHMRATNRGGTIINIASILGMRQSGHVAPYSVSKAGLVQLTKVMALELARFSIRVNALAPGYIETDMNREFMQSPAGTALLKRIPQRRLGRPEDLDGPLLLLASDASRYMTGSTIVIDGGRLVSTL